MESPSGRPWPKNKPRDVTESGPVDIGRPVFCAQLELDALHCFQTNGKGSQACNGSLDLYRHCIDTQKKNIQAGVIDCSTFHTDSLRCLEQFSYDKEACRDQFLNYKMCNGQRQASIRWQRKIGNIK
jgi:hypothetical protein